MNLRPKALKEEEKLASRPTYGQIMLFCYGVI